MSVIDKFLHIPKTEKEIIVNAELGEVDVLKAKCNNIKMFAEALRHYKSERFSMIREALEVESSPMKIDILNLGIHVGDLAVGLECLASAIENVKYDSKLDFIISTSFGEDKTDDLIKEANYLSNKIEDKRLNEDELFSFISRLQEYDTMVVDAMQDLKALGYKVNENCYSCEETKNGTASGSDVERMAGEQGFNNQISAS